MNARPIVYALFAVMNAIFVVGVPSTSSKILLLALCGYWMWLALRALEPARQRNKR